MRAHFDLLGTTTELGKMARLLFGISLLRSQETERTSDFLTRAHSITSPRRYRFALEGIQAFRSGPEPKA